jgi:hypothetical protein
MTEQNDMLDPLGLNSDMTVNNSMSTFKREFAPKGNRQGVIAFVIPAGTHVESFPPKPPETKKKVLVIFELKDRKEDGKRFVKNKKWTYSMSDKSNMRNDLNSMGFDTNSDFNLKSLVGQNFIVNITHETDKKGNVTRDKLGDFTSFIEGMEPMVPESTELPDWAKVYISESVEYKEKFGDKGPYEEAIKKDKERKAKYGDNNANAATGAAPAGNFEESDLPF